MGKSYKTQLTPEFKASFKSIILANTDKTDSHVICSIKFLTDLNPVRTSEAVLKLLLKQVAMVIDRLAIYRYSHTPTHIESYNLAIRLKEKLTKALAYIDSLDILDGED